jgi:hypothetical protein
LHACNSLGQVDGHPQSDGKNGSVNGVEHRKPAANATIAEAYHTNADRRRPQKHPIRDLILHGGI